MEIPGFLDSGSVFSYSGSEEVWIGWDAALRSDSPMPSSLSIYAPDFFLLDEKPWWNFQFFAKVNRTQLISLFKEVLSQTEKFTLNWSEPDYSLFESAFEGLKTQFKLGLLKKAVPVVFEKAEISLGTGLLSLLSNLLQTTKDLPFHLYGVWNRNEGILGGTPELLFKQELNRPLTTMALAGTRLNGDSRGSLLEDPKELEEHQFVIDGIYSSLREYGRVDQGKTQVLTLPNLSHLYTPLSIDLNLQEKDAPHFEAIVKKLHPTPALGAFPREAGLRWLRDYEQKVKRRRFGAPFGVVTTKGESHCVVSIRNIQWSGKLAYLGAGCGIIAASELGREWREIRGKMDSVKRLLGLNAGVSEARG